jgi:hypothetical protein
VNADVASQINRWATFSLRAPLAVLSPFEEVIRSHTAENVHPQILADQGPNKAVCRRTAIPRPPLMLSVCAAPEIEQPPARTPILTVCGQVSYVKTRSAQLSPLHDEFRKDVDDALSLF